MSEQRHHPLGVPSTSGAGTLSGGGRVGSRAATSVTGLDRWLLRRIAAACASPPVEMALWNGEVVHRPEGESYGRIVWCDRGALWAVMRLPELGFGDMYSTGRIVVEGDLVEVLFRSYRAADQSREIGFKRNLLGRLPKAASNTRTGSRRHIHHHYDLGNEFYRLWLDEEMVYTCAYYPHARATLEEAQIAKMHHVARKLRLEPGMEVIEAGCGWGSLALHMARHYGVSVRAYNISREQVAYARERAAREGLDDRVEFIAEDYRNITGRCDAFVSVGMLEHVGLDNYAALGDVIERVLERHGLALVHSVGRSFPAPPNAWLEQRIFPGSYPPSLGQMMHIFEPNQFSVLDVENLRLHYAKTLAEWLERFDAHEEQVLELYDVEFVRAWRLYLAGCAAAFLASSIQLFQIVVARPEHNRLAHTRENLYGDRQPDAWTLEA